MRELHYINNMKFFLIYTVVLGHVLEFNRAFELHAAVYHVIYTFHMPAFIFLSGVLWHKLNWRRIGIFLLYYFVFQIVFAFIRQQPLNYLVPQYHLWFLLSLITWSLVAQALTSIPNRSFRIMFICLLLSLSISSRFLDFGIDTDTLAYQRTLSFLPFFLFGHLLGLAKLTSWRDTLRKTTKGHVCLVASALLLVFFLYVILQQNGLDYLFRGSKNYTDGPLELSTMLLTYATPSLMLILLSALIPNKATIISRIGRNSFPIFIYHPLFTLILRTYFRNRLSFVTCLLLSTCIIVLIFTCQTLVNLAKTTIIRKLKRRTFF